MEEKEEKSNKLDSDIDLSSLEMFPYNDFRPFHNLIFLKIFLKFLQGFTPSSFDYENFMQISTFFMMLLSVGVCLPVNNENFAYSKIEKFCG